MNPQIWFDIQQEKLLKNNQMNYKLLPLKKKFNLTLNTSRGTRASFQESCTSKSPFKCNTDQIIKCNQLEQELHRSNQQRKLLELELDDLNNQYLRKSSALHDCEMENLLLKQQIQAIRQQQEIQKLSYTYKQKNQSYLEQYHKFRCMEKTLESENNLEQQIKQLSEQNESMKQQLLEMKLQYKIIQDNYKEIKEERNSLYQKLVEIQTKGTSKDDKIKQLENDNNLQQSQRNQLTESNKKLQEQIKQLSKIQEKKEKWKIRYKNYRNEVEYQQIESRKSSDSQQVQEGQKNSSDQNNLVEELTELKDKLQQLEVENQYLREQNIEMQTQLQLTTDKLLKQQLQNSLSKEQSQAFSFQQYNQNYYKSNQQQEEHE
ncbi:unnamed protein product [Paramecium octaurelia]|uniref:Uncharacterized protein n=1 Tax=Paramecium octaurelia TaxID=43137 RepID=A0A8S1VYQ5_PAROT|nr:unnamed protein product [Paramecium octaurelia]